MLQLFVVVIDFLQILHSVSGSDTEFRFAYWLRAWQYCALDFISTIKFQSKSKKNKKKKHGGPIRNISLVPIICRGREEWRRIHSQARSRGCPWFERSRKREMARIELLRIEWSYFVHPGHICWENNLDKDSSLRLSGPVPDGRLKMIHWSWSRLPPENNNQVSWDVFFVPSFCVFLVDK
jgi:hypothetical protein